MEKFHRLLDLCIKHNRVLGIGLLSLLTAGGEHFFSSVVFQCPCNATWNLPYSLVFFLVPALVLFPLGYPLNSQAGQVVTGCCGQDQKDTFWSTCCKADPGPCGRTKMCCQMVFCSQITLAAMASVTWIAVALLEGSYYECAASGSVWVQKHLCQDQKSNCSEKVLQMSCQKTNSKEVKELLKELRAQSQFKFLKIYEKGGNEIFKTESKRDAAELAERDVKYFFENVQLKSVRIPSCEDWMNILKKDLEIHPTDCSPLYKDVNNWPFKKAIVQNSASNCD